MMRSHQSWRTADMQRRRLFVAMLLSELLPIDGASAGTIRNRTQESRAPAHAIERAQRTTTPPGGAVVVGLDGGYVHSRHREEERHFEVIAGKVINAAGTQQQRFAFVRNDKAISADAFAQTLAVAGIHADTLATVLYD
jgi:hypothetical protein